MDMDLRQLPNLIHLFINYPGCFILGAGASSKIVPFGHILTRSIVERHTRGGSFPVKIPRQDDRTLRIISEHLQPEWNDDGLFWNEKAKRIPSSFALLTLFHELAKPAYGNAVSYNYLVFRLFHRSSVVNYNLDGLASRICSPKREVIEVHGTVHPGFGKPEIREIIKAAQDYNLDLAHLYNIYCILFEKENESDPLLFNNHTRTAKAIKNSRFVAVIGYSFARTPVRFDDYRSLEFISNLLRFHRKNAFVLDPVSLPVTEELMERTKSKNVFAVPVTWNVLASIGDLESIEYKYKAAFDEEGE